MSDVPEVPGARDDPMSRSDMARVRQALRQDWEIPPETRAKILTRLVDYVVEEGGDGRPANQPRIILAAARTLAAFARLTLAQQQLDARVNPSEGAVEELSMRDLCQAWADEAYAAELSKKRFTTSSLEAWDALARMVERDEEERRAKGEEMGE